MVRHRLLALPLAGTAATFALSLLISDQSGLQSHRFLLWNLFLAWIPLLAAGALYLLRRRALPALLLGAVWLFFLPNAPYLVTDLIHVGELNQAIPAWLDLATLVTAAASGLLLAVLALLYVHAALRERYGRRSWIFVAAVVPLTSFGVYLGRGPRFNSWDVVDRPALLVELAADRLSSPQDHPMMVTGVLLFSLGLAFSYTLFYAVTARGRRG